MELIDFILEIDCVSQFYDWGKLTVSIVTNHTWTTAALSRDQEPNFPASAKKLCWNYSPLPSSKTADLAVTKDTAQGSRQGQEKNKRKKAIDRTGYPGTKQNIQPE